MFNFDNNSEIIKNLLLSRALNNSDREAYLRYDDVGYKGLKSEFCDKIISWLYGKSWITYAEVCGNGMIRCIVAKDLI